MLSGALSEEQTRLRQRSISKDYTLNKNSKGCTHNDLSFWSYVLVYVGRSSCQQLTANSKCLSADRLRGVNTDTSTWLLPSDLFRTYSQTENSMANISQSKRVFTCNPMHDLRESRYKTSQAYFRLPQSRLQASTKRTYVFASDSTQDKLNRDKMAGMIAAGAHGVSNSRL